MVNIYAYERNVGRTPHGLFHGLESTKWTEWFVSVYGLSFGSSNVISIRIQSCNTWRSINQRNHLITYVT